MLPESPAFGSEDIRDLFLGLGLGYVAIPNLVSFDWRNWKFIFFFSQRVLWIYPHRCYLLRVVRPPVDRSRANIVISRCSVDEFVQSTEYKT